jgi:hypothetical protein
MVKGGVPEAEAIPFAGALDPYHGAIKTAVIILFCFPLIKREGIAGSPS